VRRRLLRVDRPIDESKLLIASSWSMPPFKPQCVPCMAAPRAALHHRPSSSVGARRPWGAAAVSRASASLAALEQSRRAVLSLAQLPSSALGSHRQCEGVIGFHHVNHRCRAHLSRLRHPCHASDAPSLPLFLSHCAAQHQTLGHGVATVL
jgi:hypothetical protein